MKKEKKKIIFIIITIVLLILTIFYIIRHNYNIKEYEKSIEGIKVTMLGGSNIKEKGNINSCSYIIRTRNNQLIIVDGGRDIDSEIVQKYIMEYNNGVVNHWYITHPHDDHVGALIKLLNDENSNIIIENLYYSFNTLEWYEKYDARDFETEKKIINALSSNKIKNKIECTKNQIIQMDNIKCEILKIANPEIINSDNGNESSMVFKMTATDVNKSIIFLGDAFTQASIELLKTPEKLKADAVQMAHHGQNGVTKEVYEAIRPEICFFNSPEWLYNNDSGTGYNTGPWKTIEVREWMKEMHAQSFVAYEGDITLRFTSEGYEVIN